MFVFFLCHQRHNFFHLFFLRITINAIKREQNFKYPKKLKHLNVVENWIFIHFHPLCVGAIAVAQCFILVILILDSFPVCVAVLPDNFYGTFRFQVYNCVTHTTIDDSSNGTEKKSTPTAITISNNGDNGMWKCSNSLKLVSFSLSVAVPRRTSIRSTRK